MPNRRELGYVSAGSTSTIPATTGYGVATGGTSSSITVSSENYTLLAFTSDSNLVVTSAGLFDVCLIAGGGGASGSFPGAGYSSPGAGGGGVLGISSTISLYIAAGTYTVDVGAGGSGAGTNVAGTLGFASSIGNFIQAVGGGASGNFFNQAVYAPTRGGSGGGVTYGSGPLATAIGTLQGNNGGAGVTNEANSGGGGGAGSAGGNGSGTTGGAGGNGIDISGFISGATYYAAAGGGGGGTGTGGAAGNGGVAGKTSGTSNNGVNYGAGAGGTVNAAGGNGAAGVVYVRFKV